MPIKFQKGTQLYRVRRFADALAILGRTAEMAPGHYAARAFQGLTLIAMDRCDEAVTTIERSLGPFQHHPALLMVIAYGLAISGRHREARQAYHDLEEAGRARYVPALLRGMVLGALRDIDAAFEAFERAVEERYPQMNFLAVDPVYDPVQRDRRFAGLLDKLGLPRRSWGSQQAEVAPHRASDPYPSDTLAWN